VELDLCFFHGNPFSLPSNLLFLIKTNERLTMPFFQLSETDLGFPPAHFADEQGMIAVGGDLSSERLLHAYRNGIYFWFGPMDFIKWWSPDPRLLLLPEEAEQPAAVTPVPLDELTVTYDQAFEPLLRKVQEAENQPPMAENWVTEEMINSYLELHERGYAHSLEIKKGGEWVAGIFGILIEKAFFAEYTYSPMEGGATLALSLLAQRLKDQGIHFIDVQKESIASRDIGFTEQSRMAYLDRVKAACEQA